ncbi:MAG: DUF502 domain-containing protein [Rhodobacteraceae bacterium]|nr:DUF502 domain-containing protein [Paracoccaceae bacterium]MBT4777519.1 DUF502 domain-containing protein [Paracoccaceae bacterium]MBT6270624.1 DUF502 domain-containing protein [Paracoccaceae bacterium]
MATKDKNPNKSYSFRVLAKVRGNFLAGLIVIAPIGFTMWIINSIIGWIDGWVLPLIPYNYHFAEYIGINLKGLGVIFFLVFTVLVGWVAKGILGRTFLRVGENLVDRTPIVRSVYSGIKQIAETVLSSRDSSFEKACLIEYPRKGIWAIAFVASDSRGEIAEKNPDKENQLVSVFIPTTPNPTSGFLLFIPKSDIKYLDMTIEEAAKLVISAGLVYPKEKK